MQKNILIVLICFIVISVKSSTSALCDANEYAYKLNGKYIFCCMYKSCRLYKGGFSGDQLEPLDSLIELDCLIDVLECGVDNYRLGPKVHFVCGSKSDCKPIKPEELSDSEYCCRSQFCTFGSACALESLSSKLSKPLFDALLAVSVVLFVANLTVNGILFYKICASNASKEGNYIVRDNTPGLNIFLPAQYEGGQGMTPGGEIINVEKDKAVRPRKTRKKKRQIATPDIAEDPTPSYPMPDPVATSYLEDHQTQDYAVPPLPEDLNADLGGAQFQQTEDMVGVQLGNMSLNGHPGMEVDDNPAQEYIEDPNAMPDVEDVNY